MKVVCHYSYNMCGRIIHELDNHTLEAKYNFFFEQGNFSEYEKFDPLIVGLRLSNIVFVAVILVLISIMATFYVVIKAIAGELDIPVDDAILIDRIKALRNEMNPSELKTPNDPNSEYQMRDNRTPKNTSVEGDHHQIAIN